MKDFEVGDIVRIRAWHDMVEEFGVDDLGDIRCRRTFIADMRHLCGELAEVYSIGSRGYVKLTFLDSPKYCYSYSYSVDMIEHATEIESVKVIYPSEIKQFDDLM